MTVLEELSPEKKECISEIRKRLRNDMKLDMYNDTQFIYRFLKARDFNVNQAEIMLKKHLEWRKEFDVDNIVSNYKSLEALEKYFPSCLMGYDKDGCPVKYFAIGNIDPKGIRRAAKFIPDIVKHVIRSMEVEMVSLKSQSEKIGKVLPGSVYIIDCNNISFSVVSDKKTLEHLIYFAKMYQDNYPERLKAAYIINVSRYVNLGFNIVKTFIAASILQKIKFVSTEEIPDTLLNIIEADELPKFLGGNLTDPDGDPLCKSFVNHGGVVPEKYFVNKNKQSLIDAEGVKKLVIPRASFSEIELTVSKVGSMIEWDFETKCRDIGFGLFFKETDGEEEKITELVPLLRLDTEDFSETGIHKCDQVGTYIILFDNSYSWVRSKEIYYMASVKSPEEHEMAK